MSKAQREIGVFDKGTNEALNKNKNALQKHHYVVKKKDK